MQPRRTRLPVILALLGLLAMVLSGAAVADFGSASSSGMSISSDRIFPGTRTSPAWSVSDASSATPVDATFSTAVGEGATFTTGTPATTYSGSRYIDFTYAAPLPGGLSASSVAFSFDFSSSVSGQTACFYFEVYKASNSALLGTHGSSGSSVGCATGTGLTHTSTSLPEVSTSDIANDLRVRVYVEESGPSPLQIDLATVTGSTYAGFTLYPTEVGDRSTGTLSTTTWGLAAPGDGAAVTTNAWATAFSASRYVSFTFPDEAPTSATVTSASFTLSYRAGTDGSSSCWYFEVYNGSGSLIGTHGSSGSTISCNSSGSSWQTDTVSLPEINSGSLLNSVKVTVYFATSGPSSVDFDLARLSGTYSLSTA